MCMNAGKRSGKLDCLLFFSAQGNFAGSDGHLRESNLGLNEFTPVGYCVTVLIFVSIVISHKSAVTTQSLFYGI